MKSFLEGSYDLNLTHFAQFQNFGLVKGNKASKS